MRNYHSASSKIQLLTPLRDALPSIGRLELDKIKKDAVDFTPRYPSVVSLSVSTAPLVSPTAMFSGPPLPYSYPSSAASSAPALSGYISPPASHRTGEDEKESSSVHRQSLPSIKEALGGDKPLPYTAPVPSGPPAPPPQQHSSYSQLPPASTAPRSHTEAPPGPPNPFSHNQAPVSLLRENPYGPRSNQPPHSHTETSSQAASNNHMDPRMPTLNSLHGMKSPLQGPRAAPPLQTSQPTPAYDYAGNSAGSISSINGYSSYQPPYSFQSQPPSAHPSTYQPPTYEPRNYGSDWKTPGADIGRPEDSKKPIPNLGAPYGESVKRHLEFFDIDTSLNDVGVLIKMASEVNHVNKPLDCQWQQENERLPPALPNEIPPNTKTWPGPRVITLPS